MKEKQLITDRVKTLQDACRECGKDYETEFAEERIKWLTPDELAYKQKKMITQALNEGWVPDWSNQNEKKYFPWYEHSGSGLSFFDGDYTRSLTYVGSRLVFKNPNHVRYAVTQFPDTYNVFFNL